MGITGLLPFVKPSCRPANIKDFSGASVAVDTYSWLHKGAFSCAEKLVKGEKTDGYVHYCLKQLNLLLQAGLKPVMVFDGCNLSSKAVTEKKRRENREKTRQRGKELLCEGKIKEARECFQRCVDVTPEMAKEVIEAFRKKSVDCIVAPYEADAQLAYLNKIGMVQIVITEDSDLILFGCNKILFKMDACGGGLLYEKENLPKSFGNKAINFSFEKFRYMCILSGCDYLPSLPGIGLAKANKFFSLTNNPDILVVLSKLPSYLKMPKLVVSEEYKESFIKANNTFLYQLAFCPKKRCLVPLNDYPEGSSSTDFEYAGKYLPDDVACQLAMGNINVKTMEEFDEYSFSSTPIDEEKSFVWGSQNSSSSQASNSSKLSAFKFSTPKQKMPAPKKRTFIEMVDSGFGANCTDEELFSMYGKQDSKKSCSLSVSSEEDPLAEEKICLTKEENPLPKYNLPNIPFRKSAKPVDSGIGADCTDEEMFSMYGKQDTKRSCSLSVSSEDDPLVEEKSCSPKKESTLRNSKLPNIPFRKIVKSRFFATEHDLNKDYTLETSKVQSARTDNDSCLLSDNGVSSLNSSIGSSMSDSDLSPEPRIHSPKKSNKENIVHRFAKTKPGESKRSKSLPSNCNLSSPTKAKNSWLDIIDNESANATSTLSSSGESSKLLDSKCENSTSEPKKPPTKGAPRKLISTKLLDFKWKTTPYNVPNLNCSLGSHESSVEVIELENESNNDSFVSPYFSSGNESSQVISLESDSEVPDTQSQKSSVMNSLLNSTKAYDKTSSKTSKVGKCRTIGLSKKKKSCDKVPRKETLLNFNFIRQPKKEVPIT